MHLKNNSMERLGAAISYTLIFKTFLLINVFLLKKKKLLYFISSKNQIHISINGFNLQTVENRAFV
jgi:hypothetical protein